MAYEKKKKRMKAKDIIDPVDETWNSAIDFNEIIQWLPVSWYEY